MKNRVFILSNLVLVLFLTALLACGNSMSKGFSITGKVTGAENMQVLMEQFHFDRTTKAIGKVAAGSDGSFTFTNPEGLEKGIYRIAIGAKQIYFILDGTEKVVNFNGNLNTIQTMDIQVEGSEAMACYAKQINELNKNQGGFTPEIAAQKVEAACNPLMGAFLTSQFYGQGAVNFIPQFKSASDKLAAFMPDSKYAKDYASVLNQIQTAVAQQQAAAQAPAGGVQVGQPAPDISLPDPSGKVRSLSGLKGKIVLLDFWASWCGPCRRENPHVVEVYNKYKGQGFTVFSVSLDKETGKDAWMQAIKQDGLVWENHVSDLKFWQSAAATLYGVRSIPQTYLLDREGKIAAVNPRSNLEEAVQAALAKK